MKESRNKTTLAMMELAIMILVFAIAAAVCLQAFAFASRRSKQSEKLRQSVVLAQLGAESLKGNKGDLTKTREEIKEIYPTLTDTDSGFTLSENDLLMTVEKEKSEGLLGSANITVTDEYGTIIYELSVKWQEDAADET
jgi:type II secretory pathway pseudopilin PulG